MNRTLEAAYYMQPDGYSIQLLRCEETNPNLFGYPFYALRCLSETGQIQQGVYGATQEWTQHIFKDWQRFEHRICSVQVE